MFEPSVIRVILGQGWGWEGEGGGGGGAGGVKGRDRGGCYRRVEKGGVNYQKIVQNFSSTHTLKKRNNGRNPCARERPSNFFFFLCILL